MNKNSFYKVAGLMTHMYTMIGGVLGFFALIMASKDMISEAFIFLLLSMAIDGTDGILARKFDVTKHFPFFDGAMVDNVIDMFTYAWVPFFIIWKLDSLSPWYFIVFPIFASLYAYGQSNMKTDDHYFLGFPTYWNIVALYIYLLSPNSVINSIMILVFTVLSFVPTKYLYPSRQKGIKWLYFGLGTVWSLLVVLALSNPEKYKMLGYVSLFYPLLYLVHSFVVDRKLKQTI